MIRKNTAVRLLNKYRSTLEQTQEFVSNWPNNNQFINKIPNVIEALEKIAQSDAINKDAQVKIKNNIGYEFSYICYKTKFNPHLYKEIKEFYTTIEEMVEHPNDKHFNRVHSAYSNFFGNTLAEGAFYPFVAAYKHLKGNDFSYGSDVSAMFFTLCLSPLLIFPTIPTFIIALAIGVLAALTSVLSYSGAAIADLIDDETHDDKALTI